MDVDKIGKYIYKLREQSHLSQKQLAEMIPISRQAVSNWENGRTIPSSDTLIILSKIFNVSVDELLAGGPTEKENNLEDIALDLIDEYNDKRKKIRRHLIIFIITIAVLLILFLGYYFVTSYNSIKVYRVDGVGKRFQFYDGVLLTTKQKAYLRLGKIKNESEKDIKKIGLYFLDKNHKKHLIQETDDTDILITTRFGYDEFIDYNYLTKALDKMYMIVTYDDNKKETIKLNFRKDFTNDALFTKEDPNVERKDTLKKNVKSSSNLSKEITTNLKDISTSTSTAYTISDKNLKEVKVENKVEKTVNIVEVPNDAINEKEDSKNPNNSENTENKTIEVDINELPKKIDSAMKRKGSMIDAVLNYEIEDNDNKIKFSYTDVELMVTIKHDKIKEVWSYFLDESNLIFYYKFIDNNEIDFKYIVYENVNEIGTEEKEIQKRLISYIQNYLLKE